MSQKKIIVGSAAAEGRSAVVFPREVIPVGASNFEAFHLMVFSENLR